MRWRSRTCGPTSSAVPSAGAINAAYFAADPTPAGVSALDRLWCGLTRRQIMPTYLRDLLRVATRRGYIVDPSALRAYAASVSMPIGCHT